MRAPMLFVIKIGPASGGYEWKITRRREVSQGFHQDRRAALDAAFAVIQNRFEQVFPADEYPKVGPLRITIG